MSVIGYYLFKIVFTIYALCTISTFDYMHIMIGREKESISGHNMAV